MRVLFFILVIFISNLSAQTAFEKATKSAKNGDYKRALAFYEQSLKKNPGDKSIAKLHFNIGICRYHLKQMNEAAAAFTQAIEASGGDYQKAFYALGMAQVELKNRRAAKAAFLDALKLKTDDGEAWFDLALVYLEERNLEAAETTFRNSIEYKSVAAADAHNNLGVIYMLGGNYAFAESEFKAALDESNGNSIEAANNLKFCLFYKGNETKELIANLEISRRNQNSGV
jgi:Flp pilus assembly protein TadD